MPQAPKNFDRGFWDTSSGVPMGPSDGVALEAPIVAFGFLQHLPEGALPLTGLLRHDRKVTADDLFEKGVQLDT